MLKTTREIRTIQIILKIFFEFFIYRASIYGSESQEEDEALFAY